jgi:hypothetical protein
MSFRQTGLVLVVAAAAFPVVAQTGGTLYRGEIGFVPDVPKSYLTREQVKQDLANFVRDGGRVAAGEMGMIPSVRGIVDPVNATILGNAPRQTPSVTPADERMLKDASRL